MSNKTINIYIQKDQRKLIDNLKVKYQLSLTTIIDVLCEITADCLFLNADENIKDKFYNQHLYVLGDKTSIKTPNWLKKQNLDHKNRYCNNVLQAYLTKNINLYIKNDILTGKYGYWNRVESELQKREDDWWQYNKYIRMQKRYERTKNGTKTEN